MDGKPTSKLPAEFSWNTQVAKDVFGLLIGIVPGLPVLFLLIAVVYGWICNEEIFWELALQMGLLFGGPFFVILLLGLLFPPRNRNQTYRVDEDGIAGFDETKQLWRIRWHELAGAYGRKLHCSDGRAHEVCLNNAGPAFWKLAFAEWERRHPEAVAEWKDARKKRSRRYFLVTYPLWSVFMSLVVGLLCGLADPIPGLALALILIVFSLGVPVLLTGMLAVDRKVRKLFGWKRTMPE